MHINVFCPRCGSRYQLKPELRGQRMRCPKAICREVFEVKESAEPTPESGNGDAAAAAETEVKLDTKRKPPEPEKNYKAGAVGEIVPLVTSEAAEELPAEQVPLEPVAEQKPAEAPSWQQAPPPPRRRPAPEAPKSPPPTPPTAPAAPAAPAVPAPAAPPAWEQAPPPVRKSTPEKPPAKAPETPPIRTAKAPRAKQTMRTTPERPEPGTQITPDLPVVSGPPPTGIQVPSDKPAAPWEPPPVRRAIETMEAPTSTPLPPPNESPPTEVPPIEYKYSGKPAKKQGSAKKLMIGMVLLAGLVGGGAILWTRSVAVEPEDVLADRAKTAYNDAKFRESSQIYAQLLKKYPESPRSEEFRFWKDFGDVRFDVNSFDIEGADAYKQLRAFVAAHEKGPFLPLYHADLWETYHKLLDRKLLHGTEEKITKDNSDKIRKAIDLAKDVQIQSDRYSQSVDGGEEIKRRIARVRDELSSFEDLQLQLVELDKPAERTWDQIIELEESLHNRGYLAHPEVRQRLEKIRSGWLFEGNRYIAWKEKPLQPSSTDDAAPGLLVAPRVDATGATVKSPGVVFALARGVLYALNEKDGSVRWARRVGIDMTTLPVRLPAGETNAELVLVLSSDTNTLTACDAFTGEAQWSYDLGQPCLGRPVIVGRRAYVATTSTQKQRDGKSREEGRVHEIEIVKGTVLGEYRLGLPLTGSGARQEGTNLLYFPADRGYVYVLDVDKKQCVAMLNTGHPSGSLRGEPILVGDDTINVTNMPRFLILSQADGLDAMKLRAYRLPLEKVVNTPALQPEPLMRGWSWFQPHCDGEKIVLATDAGVLGLFGINQFHNQDQPLFPLVPPAYRKEDGARQPGRALVVHATESDFWVLAEGNMQHWRMGLGAEKGLKIAPLWKEPLALGSPLHAGQVNETRDTLFVVTQSPARQACLATAVDAASGKVRWQRQLGLRCQGDPTMIGSKIGVLDHGGSLFVFDPEPGDKKPHLLPVVPGEAPGPISWLLPGADGNSVYTVTAPSAGKLVLRRYSVAKKAGENVRREFTLPDVPGGTPALGGEFLVLPLADGRLVRQSLADTKEGFAPGPYWRAPHADAGALGHAVHLGGDDYLVTDGSKGLRRIIWPKKESWTAGAERQLDDRIVAAPLVLPGGDGRILVADSAGNVLLLQGEKLKEVRRWPLEGKITAGPFLRGDRIGCVVDRKQLVWIDTAKEAVLWKYTTPGETIVGQPHEAGGLVIVADQAGKFVALDVEKGEPRGSGFTLKASVAPAAAPVGFGADRIFAPLTDGTILLLPIKQLTEK
ncbi:MAG: PQQ-binding-like beta-propeller repeat protein [Gemmataceae bacterium]|nr:PQQ-binding-like beta-propeller repeat protein [Gemmataceae bacterium]